MGRGGPRARPPFARGRSGQALAPEETHDPIAQERQRVGRVGPRLEVAGRVDPPGVGLVVQIAPRARASGLGAAQGVGDEMRALVRAQAERLIADMDLVGREEFEAMKALAVSAQAETEELKARLDALETKLAAKAKPSTTRRKPKS